MRRGLGVVFIILLLIAVAPKQPDVTASVSHAATGEKYVVSLGQNKYFS